MIMNSVISRRANTPNDLLQYKTEPHSFRSSSISSNSSAIPDNGSNNNKSNNNIGYMFTECEEVTDTQATKAASEDAEPREECVIQTKSRIVRSLSGYDWDSVIDNDKNATESDNVDSTNMEELVTESLYHDNELHCSNNGDTVSCNCNDEKQIMKKKSIPHTCLPQEVGNNDLSTESNVEELTLENLQMELAQAQCAWEVEREAYSSLLEKYNQCNTSREELEVQLQHTKVLLNDAESKIRSLQTSAEIARAVKEETEHEANLLFKFEAEIANLKSELALRINREKELIELCKVNERKLVCEIEELEVEVNDLHRKEGIARNVLKDLFATINYMVDQVVTVVADYDISNNCECCERDCKSANNTVADKTMKTCCIDNIHKTTACIKKCSNNRDVCVHERLRTLRGNVFERVETQKRCLVNLRDSLASDEHLLSEEQECWEECLHRIMKKEQNKYMSVINYVHAAANKQELHIHFEYCLHYEHRIKSLQEFVKLQ